jgi:hypothetical protein
MYTCMSYAPRPSLSLSLSLLSLSAGPRVPSGGVTHKRRCTYRPSVTYLIINKLLSLSLCLSLSVLLSLRSLSVPRQADWPEMKEDSSKTFRHNLLIQKKHPKKSHEPTKYAQPNT